MLDEHRKAQIRQLATDFPKLWTDPATPARERKRIARLLIEDVTLNSWKARQTDPDPFKMLDRLLDDHTDGETAQQLNAAGRRTGMNKSFTPHIIVQLRRAHDLPSHHQRLQAHGMLTIDQTAKRLGVHISTIKAWHRAGLLTSHKANDRNERLFDPPDPTDPRLTPRRSETDVRFASSKRTGRDGPREECSTERGSGDPRRPGG